MRELIKKPPVGSYQRGFFATLGVLINKTHQATNVRRNPFANAACFQLSFSEIYGTGDGLLKDRFATSASADRVFFT
jgi:hypothetical protein